MDGRARAVLAGDDADAIVELGCDLADAGRQQDALSCFQRAVELGNEWVWFNVGNTLRDLDRPQEAVDAYRRAVRAGETDAWLNLGYLLEAAADLDGAATAFREAGAAGQPEGFVELAHLERDRGDDDAAELALRRAGSFPPALAELACWDWERTLDPALEGALRDGSAVSGAARASLAALLLLTRRPLEAQQQLELGAKLGQRECWLPLGNVLAERVGDLEAAEEAYRAGIAAGDAYCHHNLALLLLERGDVAQAEFHLSAGSAAGDDLAERALRSLHRRD